jgi:hypothetical protein
MSSESIERFNYTFEDGIWAMDQKPEGKWVRYSDHGRIVKELEARLEHLGTASEEWAKTIDRIAAWSDWESSKYPLAEHVNNLVGELKRLRITPSLSDAIKEVEKMRNEQERPSDQLVAADLILERLKSLSPQRED